jgi:hemoglobin
MYSAFRSGRAAFLACLLSFAFATVVSAEEKPSGKAPDTKALDAYLYTSLRSVINLGVEQYNAGNIDLCVQHFRQSLEQLDPVLTHRPELQAKIKSEMEKIDKDPEYRPKLAAKALMPRVETAPANRQMAFALRSILNDVRSAVGGSIDEPKAVTLWDRLGGEKNVRKVVDDFIASAAADPKVDFTRGGKYKFDPLKTEDLKKKLVEMISEATGGPLKYTGRDMKTVHKGMGITNEEFDATAGHLKAALEKNGVKPAEVNAVMTVVGSMRKDIVEGKKVEPVVDEGTVTGKVTLDGKPLLRGTVNLVKVGKTFQAPIAAGDYAFTKIPVDRYTITITGNPDVPPIFTDVAKSPLTLEVKKGPNTNVDLKLTGGKKPEEGVVSGKVTFDGKPLAGAKVSYVGRKGKNFSATTDDKGAFKLNDGQAIPFDQYDITVTSDNALVPKKYGDIKTSGMSGVVNIPSIDHTWPLLKEKPEPKPEEEASLNGSVTLDGKPLAKGTINLSKVGRAFAAPIAADGKYKIAKLEPGTYAISVINNPDVPEKYTQSKTSPLTYEVKAGANNFDVSLVGEKKPVGGSVKGKVTLDGKPVAKGEVILWCPQTGVILKGPIANDGTYQITGTAEKPLESREHSLMIAGPEIPGRYGENQWAPPFQVKDGSNTLDLSLKTDRKLPEGLQFPGPHVTLMELRASGEQIYESQASPAGGFEWVLQGPSARLTDELTGEPQGKHYGSPNGPVWEIKGFAVTGEVLSKVDAKAGNIPWLLLRVTHIEPQRPGGFTPGLSSIQRIDTEGGVAPAKAPEKAGELVKVPYKATYLVSVGAKTAEARKERKIPDTIAAPPGHKRDAAGELDVEGVHVYESKAKAGGGLEWSLKEAVGTLIDKTESIGKFSISPGGLILEIKDIKITADVAKKAEAAAGRIPWSLLQVKKMTIKGEDFKDGTPVSYIQFVDAEGRITPAKPPEKAGEIAKVPFQASLIFYEGKAEEKKPIDKPKGETKPEEKKLEEGTLSGTVLLDGKPLAGGKLDVVGSDGNTIKGVLDDKGHFTTNEGKPLPVGSYKIAILSDDPRVPKKYADVKTSGLAVFVNTRGFPTSLNLSSKETGGVFGYLLVDKKFLSGGKVVLLGDDSKTYSGVLNDKGVFKINDGKPIPPGVYKAKIETEDPLLAKKYADVKTSGLTVTVTMTDLNLLWHLDAEKPEK